MGGKRLIRRRYIPKDSLTGITPVRKNLRGVSAVIG
jgi:hypothetical protein